jgi:phage shock protein E
MCTHLRVSLLLTILALAPACASEAERTANAAPALAADGLPAGPFHDRDPALAKQLVDGGALLLDVRTPEEYAAGHLDGAINIDHAEVGARLDEIRKWADGDLHKPVVLYCRSGRRAGIVKQQLLDAGFERVTNLGGLSDWPG